MNPDPKVMIVILCVLFVSEIGEKHFYPVESLANSVSQRQTSNLCTGSHLTKPPTGLEWRLLG